MYHSVLKLKKIVGLSFSKLSFKLASVYTLPQSSAKQNTLGVKNVRGQQEAPLPMCDLKL